MEIARIIENKKQGCIYGLMGNINLTTNQENIGIITSYKFKGTVKDYLNSKKASNALKMVMLENDILDKTISDLSEEELKAINLVKYLIDRKDYLVCDYFEKGFNDKEKANYKRLFKKLAGDYQKTIIIHTNDITFLWDIAEEITLVDNDQVTNIKKEGYFKIINDINKPKISEMIDLIRAKGIKIEDYKDSSDLLKAIYRIKGE